MILLKQLSKTFSSGTVNETKAVQDISLSIPAGDFVVIVGSNGSGKSTLLNILAGTVIADQGEIFFNDRSVSHLKEHQRSKWIARVFQNPLAGTAPDLTVIDNFRLAALRTRRKTLKTGTDKKFREHVKERISMLSLGLENKTEQLMGSLSGGQRQALTLIMAVMDDATILLMDEPTAALDPKTSELLMQQAAKIIAGFNLTTILVTHQLRDAHAYGNRIIQMQEGKIIRDLDAEMKKKLHLNEIFTWF
jgi:putative tryptophan/tyrosine transport system ATP-binding protein